MQRGGPKFGYEHEAFAIYDMMRNVRNPVHTLCIGTAFGEAAILLASGAPGCRAALPSATLMVRQPINRFEQMQATDVDIYRMEMRCAAARLETWHCGAFARHGDCCQLRCMQCSQQIAALLVAARQPMQAPFAPVVRI